jgi:hypothetical protein
MPDNTQYYPPSSLARTREDLKFKPFLGRVLTVDYERKVLTIESLADQTVYKEVTHFPANASSRSTTDVFMPEQGSACVAANLEYQRGFSEVVILSWIVSDAITGVDAVAHRFIESEEIQGWSDRTRGTYRKAYPGQKTASFSGGYAERIDSGWDHSGADYSRDRLDADRRTWTQITGRRVSLTGAGLGFQGPVNRPNAPNLKPTTLPDGSQEFVSYLQPGATESDRYIGGKSDVIPFAEDMQLVQEYSLDYIPPAEILQTDLLDQILGTVGDPWSRTTVTAPGGQVAYDNSSFMIQQGWDHPTNTSTKAVGPTLNEGPTPVRRGFIVEKVQGTLVGYNRFDKSTYGRVLKPVLFPYTSAGRFGADAESGYLPVGDSADHVEARLAASCFSIRFPYEYNTTRLDVTKEGFVALEVGATLPKETIPLAGGYEHPHGAGRSLEAHFVGSVKAVIGKNRDEEDAIDIQALGQAVIRLGADDTSLPNARRTVLTQIRGKGDAVEARKIQYWEHSKLKPGDSGDLENKVGAENVSLRAALDGGAIVRLGARNALAKRRHLINGYHDGPGKNPWAVGDSGRVDSHSPGRPTYGAGDSVYAFHDLTQVGAPKIKMPPYNWSGSPLTNADAHGLSLDVHAVRDILLRVGSNPASGQSILLDTAGGLVVALGKDAQGRSITGTFDGGIEVVIRPNQQGKAIRLEIQGDIDLTHKGNLAFHSTGDWITECTAWRHITKTDRVFTQQKSIDASLVRATIEAPDIVMNQGGQSPGDENS